MATVTTTANSLKMRPTTPPISRMGMNTATSDVVIEMIVKPISSLPLSAASSGDIPSSICRVMFSSMTIASSTTSPTDKCQAEKRNVVDRKAEHIHRAKRGDQRKRDRDDRDHRRGQPAQEDEDHQDDQADRQEQGELHVRHRLADGGRAVVEDVDAG